MRKNTPVAVAILLAETLAACGGNSRTDGISADDTTESVSRDDYGRDESLRYESTSDSERIRKASENKHEQGNTKGDDGTMGDEKEQ